MRIGLVVPGGVDRSGTRRVIPFLLWLIERLAGAGHDVQVFAHRQETAPGTWPLLGATVHNAGRRPRRLRSVAHIVQEHRRAPFDVLHAFWAIPSGTVAAAAHTLLGVPVVLWLPGGDLVSLPEIGYGVRASRRGRAQLHVAIKGATRVIVPSEYSLAHARALGISAQRVGFGVALDHWPITAPRARNPAAPARLLHVASLNAVKDQAMLLRAAARLQASGVAFQLDIIGEDTLGGAVQRLASELDLARAVTFHGFLEQPAVREHMLRADLLLLSSRHETVPLVLHEAAASGVPTVGTAVGELCEWAPRAAVVVPVSDDVALARNIEALLADDRRRLELAAHAQERVIAWNVDATAARMIELSREVRLERG